MIKKHIKLFISFAFRYIKKNAILKNIGVRVIDYFPSLKLKLIRIAYYKNSTYTIKSYEDLSPYAREVYNKLISKRVR